MAPTMINIAVTYRRLAAPTTNITTYDYEPVLKLLGDKLTHHYFEVDKHQPHVHMHGVVNVRKGYRRKYLMVEGFSMKPEDMYDLNGWLAYCQKDQKARKDVKASLDAQDLEDQFIDFNKSLFQKL